MSDPVTGPLTHRSIEILLERPDGWRNIVRDLVRDFPNASPLSVIFALVSAATTIDGIFGSGSPSRAASQQAIRLAALLGTDLYAMEALGLPRGRAADLAAYWRAYDDYFLSL